MSVDTSHTIILPSTDGIVRVFVPEETEAAPTVARSAACKAWGNVMVGQTPTPRPVTKQERKDTGAGQVWDFTPVRPAGRVSRTPSEPTPEVTPDATPLSSLDTAAALPARVAKLLRKFGELTTEERTMIRERIGLGSSANGTPSKAQGKGKRASRPEPRCATCRDYGLVRKAGPNAGQPYKTANGALASFADGRADTCPSCHGGKAKATKAHAAHVARQAAAS
jgi:hypothetical protein